MGRRRKIWYQACAVEVTRAGHLRFRFRWKLPDGNFRRFAETTALLDPPDNRKRVEQQAEVIGAEIRAGSCDYLKWFPNGNSAAAFGAADVIPDLIAKASISGGWTIEEYYDDWITPQVTPVVRASAARDYRSHFRNYILDVLGEVALQELSLAHLEDLRNAMRERKLSEKTIRNVIDGSLRAMVRDANRMTSLKNKKGPEMRRFLASPTGFEPVLPT